MSSDGRYDVIIIGSGAGGGTLARHLAPSGKRILILERVDLWLSTEDLPAPDDRVTLTADGSIRLAYTPDNQEPKDRLYRQLSSMLAHLGMHPDHLLPRTSYLKNEIPIAGCAHQAGTVRFGTDRATSVLDVDCKAHELDNLYAVDTSFLPSIGAVNPAFTAMANALRVGDHLLDRLS